MTKWIKRHLFLLQRAILTMDEIRKYVNEKNIYMINVSELRYMIWN